MQTTMTPEATASRARALLDSTLKHASKAALAAALVPLGAVTLPAEALVAGAAIEVSTLAGYEDNFIAPVSDGPNTTTSGGTSSGTGGDYGQASTSAHTSGRLYARSSVFVFDNDGSGSGSGGQPDVTLANVNDIDAIAFTDTAYSATFTAAASGLHKLALRQERALLDVVSDALATSGDPNRSMLEVEVKFDGSTVWQWKATLEGFDGGHSFTFEDNTGSAAGPDFSTADDPFTDGNAFYIAQAFDAVIDLGVLTAGSQHTLEYFATTDAMLGYAVEIDSNNEASAQFGDPFNINGPQDPSLTLIAPTSDGAAVPEPASALLAFGALGALALARRNRN